MQPIFKFLGYEQIEKVTIIYEDNLPAINLATNQQTRGRTKHFSVKVKFVAELIEQKVFQIQKVDSSQNCADIMSKPLGRVLFFKHRAAFMIDLGALRREGLTV